MRISDWSSDVCSSDLAFGQAFIWVFSVPRRRSAASASRLRHVDLAHHPGFVAAGDVAGELQTGVGSESPDQFLRLAGLDHDAVGLVVVHSSRTFPILHLSVIHSGDRKTVVCGKNDYVQ